MDDVVDVDTANREVVTRAGRYGYDTLVLATGSEYAYFGNDHWRAHSASLKTLEDVRKVIRVATAVVGLVAAGISQNPQAIASNLGAVVEAASA